MQVEGNDGPGTLLYGHDYYQSPQQDSSDPALAASEDADGETTRWMCNTCLTQNRSQPGRPGGGTLCCMPLMMASLKSVML